MRAIAAIAAGAAVLVASTASAAPSDPTFHAKLERGMCLGACPHYEVEIAADGQVTFTGGRSYIEPSVVCQGERQWQVSPADVATLEALIDRSGFFGFKAEYRGDMTDMAQMVVTVTRHGRTKSVTDYIGRMVGMPAAVTEIEEAIDTATQTRACVVGDRGKR